MLTISSAKAHAETDVTATDSVSDRIFDVSNGRFISKADLLQAMTVSTYILLGETHDNNRHHQIQSWLIEELASRSDSASISFEMIDNAQAQQIGDINKMNADTLVEQLSQSDAGWDYETHYQGVFESAFVAGLPIYPANIERQKLIRLMQGESVPLTDDAEQLLAKTLFSDQMNNSLQQQIIDSHCGMFDADAAQPMMKAQRLRDVAMALSLLNSSSDRRILIAGSGHVRTDRGVPVYLKSRDDDARIISLALFEYDADPVQSSTWRNNELPFDYIWFTDSAEREDPCLAFKKMNKQT